MTQKEIRDQIENMIRMNRISEQALCYPQFKVMDLLPLVDSHLNVDAKNVIQNHKTTSLIHQWNRKLPNASPFEGDEINRLGVFLGKLGLPSHGDLLVSNYVREISKVGFYGTTTSLQRVGEAAMKMADMFNDLASRNLIRAVLAPLMMVELVGGKIVVVSYIAVDQPNEALVQSLYGTLSFKEGGIPPEMI